MSVSSYYIAITVGLCLSLLIEIKLGISPGGIIVPSYVALVFDNPALLINIFLISLLSYTFVRFVLSRFVLVYGKRRFIACIMAAILFKFLLGTLFPLIPFSVLAFSGIGVVSSGILANTYFRQGIVITVITTLLTSAIVFGVMNIVYML